MAAQTALDRCSFRPTSHARHCFVRGLNVDALSTGEQAPTSTTNESKTTLLTTSTMRPTAASSSSQSGAIAGAVVGALLGVAAVMVLLLWMRRRSRSKRHGLDTEPSTVGETNVDDLLIGEFHGLEVARSCFKMEREIGRGEFGVVMVAAVVRQPGNTGAMHVHA